jgi:hypothetical protein
MEDRALLLLYYQSATCMKTEDKFSCRRPRSVDRTGQPQFVADSEVNPGSRPRGPETRSRKLPEQRIEVTRIVTGKPPTRLSPGALGYKSEQLLPL